MSYEMLKKKVLNSSDLRILKKMVDNNEFKSRKKTREHLSQEDIDRIKAEAKEQGFTEGYQDGLTACKSEINAAVQNLSEVICHLAEPIQRLDDDLEHELVDMIKIITKQFIKRELQLDNQLILSVVKQTKPLLPSLIKSVTITLHPTDIDFIKQADANLIEAAWTIVPDANLTPGGCKIESDTITIDATIEEQIQTLFTNIFDDTDDSCETTND